MMYEDVPELTQDQIEKIANGNDHEQIQRALLSAVLYPNNQEWTEHLISKFATHSEATVRRVALTCIGHMARLRKRVPEEESIRAIKSALADPDPIVKGTASDTLDDIETFIPAMGKKIRKAVSR